MTTDLFELSRTHVAGSAIGFMDIRKAPSMPVGSGTLVKFNDKVAGILTCAHVVELLSIYEAFGIVRFSLAAGALQMLQVEMKDVVEVVIGAPPWNEEGPDIAFLRLPLSVWASIAPSSDPVDVVMQRKMAVAGAPKDSNGLTEVICGVVRSATGQPVKSGATTTTPVEALMCFGAVREVWKDAVGMDRFRFELLPQEGFVLPKSFGGVSGAGLWRLHIRDDGGTFSFVSRWLTGVAFYETPEQQIICAGQQSLLWYLFEKVQKRWPEEIPPTPRRS
jgi:hypothetical protein